ncbi:MAG: UDP-glucose/GDP-mannose dehydrogenase family protein [Bacteroidales bacterium]|jgi:UDPglucose 6-dehydrogenase|nr:UDP-glucose/GDP-mannose dehydrogenase family protein [Bacteroidales bacterium]
MNIGIVGTGYVGLVTGACFSEMGMNVTCIDIDQKKIQMLQKGEIPIYEPGLRELVERNSKKERLRFSTSLADVLDSLSVVFVAVGTPPGEDGSADLSHVLEVASEFGKNIKKYTLLVIKSTVPVGTSQKVRQRIAEELERRGEKIEFDVASNPEFLKEGAAIKDFMSPDRVVVGVSTEKARHIMEKIYKPFQMSKYRIIFMDIMSAEMTKYASNSMLATRISFMNEIARLCEITGADVQKVRAGMAADTRIGNKFLYPGCGYGGSCFPKDVKALIRTGKENGYQMKIISAVEEVNQEQKKIVFLKLKKALGTLKGKTVALWGLSFKPETDDMREAPSVVVANLLLEAGAKVKVYDPIAMEECKRRYLGDKVTYAKDIYDCVQDADAMALITEWKEFRVPSWERVHKAMKGNVVVDGRDIYTPSEIQAAGFDYYSIGR